MNKESENDKIIDNIFNLLNTDLITEDLVIDKENETNEPIKNEPEIKEEGETPPEVVEKVTELFNPENIKFGETRQKVFTVEEILENKRKQKEAGVYSVLESDEVINYNENDNIRIFYIINGKYKSFNTLKTNSYTIHEDFIKPLKKEAETSEGLIAISSNSDSALRLIINSLSNKLIKVTTNTFNRNELINIILTKFNKGKNHEAILMIESYNEYCDYIQKPEMNFDNNKEIMKQYKTHIANKSNDQYNIKLKNFISNN
ncbi:MULTISPECIES: hypothetical protein [Enterobacteriaceae]|uniref:hypothetical protein n=1 Tax=Enterobacteriaceae TaxID=543 RepID=UPI000E5BD491|nr:hypothetical protein [Salmonella enterica]ECN6063082.1 hypothetical protein [Salmonella enterica subsp. enterica serovar Infantis]ELE9038622.1 hypothetical protein [Enterobacter kobei]ELG6055425.1 hypothetical protein [Escherichia coli]UAI66328.1 hypothetical protein FWW82_000155 [Salmonella enterica subsp. enterica serovar Hadar]EAN6850905.1 hypothetical protein [Salmonella enterica]